MQNVANKLTNDMKCNNKLNNTKEKCTHCTLGAKKTNGVQ